MDWAQSTGWRTGLTGQWMYWITIQRNVGTCKYRVTEKHLSVILVLFIEIVCIFNIFYFNFNLFHFLYYILALKHFYLPIHPSNFRAFKLFPKIQKRMFKTKFHLFSETLLIYLQMAIIYIYTQLILYISTKHLNSKSINKLQFKRHSQA